MADHETNPRCAPRDLDEACAELSRQEEEINQLKQALEERQRELLYMQKMAALGRLIAGISHEIKTPIGAINSMQDTLRRAVEKLKGSLESASPGILQTDRGIRGALSFIDEAQRVIGSGSTRTLEIVRRVQKFARPDEARMAEADLHAELEDTLLLLHHHLKNRITVERRFGQLPPVYCNVGQINQVLLNVLVNAAQAIEGEGTITITTRAEGCLAHVEVRDTGKGIAPEHLPRLFEPGFTTKPSETGTGLGLSICARIVSEHRGRIEIRSQQGQGTTVDISLATKGPS